jgi:hypothetical protein
VLPFDADELLGVLQANQAAVPAQIAKEAKSSEFLKKHSARH